MKTRSCWRVVVALSLLVGCGGDDEAFVYATARDAAFSWRDAAFDASIEAGPAMDASRGPSDAAVWVDGALRLPDGATFPWMPPDGSVLLDDGGLLLPDGAVIDLATGLDLYRNRERDVATCEQHPLSGRPPPCRLFGHAGAVSPSRP